MVLLCFDTIEIYPSGSDVSTNLTSIFTTFNVADFTNVPSSPLYLLLSILIFKLPSPATSVSRDPEVLQAVSSPSPGRGRTPSLASVAPHHSSSSTFSSRSCARHSIYFPITLSNIARRLSVPLLRLFMPTVPPRPCTVVLPAS